MLRSVGHLLAMDQDVPPRRRCWALSMGAPRDDETGSSRTSMVCRHFTKRLGLTAGRVAGRVGGKARAGDYSRDGAYHCGAIRSARGGDEAGGTLAGVVGAAPRVGGGLPLGRWRRSDARLVLPNPRLRLSSQRHLALPKPTAQTRPDRLRRSVGCAGLRVGHVGAAALRRISTGDRLLASLRPGGRADAGSLRGATALLDFRLVQWAASLGLEPPGVGLIGRRRVSIILG